MENVLLLMLNDDLENHLGLNAVQPLKTKIDALVNFPRPKKNKQVLSWLCLAGYYRCFLPHYSELTLPLTELLKKIKSLNGLIKLRAHLLN